MNSNHIYNLVNSVNVFTFDCFDATCHYVCAGGSWDRADWQIRITLSLLNQGFSNSLEHIDPKREGCDWAARHVFLVEVQSNAPRKSFPVLLPWWQFRIWEGLDCLKWQATNIQNRQGALLSPSDWLLSHGKGQTGVIGMAYGWRMCDANGNENPAWCGLSAVTPPCWEQHAPERSEHGAATGVGLFQRETVTE